LIFQIDQSLKQFPLENNTNSKGVTPLCAAGILGLLSQLYANKDLSERSNGVFQKLSGLASTGVGVDFAAYLTSKKYNSLDKSIAYSLVGLFVKHFYLFYMTVINIYFLCTSTAMEIFLEMSMIM
jgi:hypothetical protein